jgi:DNA-binding response OmpR family regulator
MTSLLSKGPEGRPRRVLVVEDEALIALDIETALKSGGCEVLGPVGTLAEAARLAADTTLDAAVLDINLGNEKVFSVADALAERGVPFVFLTGYETDILPKRHHDRPSITKPCRPAVLLDLLESTLRGVS